MKKILLSFGLAFMGVSAFGQSTSELFKFSQYNFGMSTARSAAMGGAFTSLGADAASMSINPAGLAMYGRSEISVTPSLLINKNKVTSNTGGITNDTKTKFVVSNFAGIFAGNNYAIGVGYSRLADYNATYSVNSKPQGSSMGEQFMWQLEGLNYKDIQKPKLTDDYKPFYNHIPYYWNAIMAYQSGLVDNINSTQYDVWRMFDYDNGDVVAPQHSVSTTGSFNEFTVSGAYNINSLIYLGVTLGVPHFTYNEFYNYSEVADGNNYGELDNFTLRQSLKMNGSGFNFKVGLTVRPTDWFRIGVAYHSPNWMTVREQSYSDMTVYTFNKPSYGYSNTPFLDNKYKISTPSRLLVGASATIAKRLILTFDYERTWYTDMNYSSGINDYGLRMPSRSNIIDNDLTIIDNIDKNGDVDYKKMVKSNYKATNNYRAGIEVQPINGLFLRAGYSYSESPYSSAIYDNITKMYDEQMLKDFGINKAADLKKIGEINRYSGGVGYRHKFFGFDLTYVYSNQKMMPTKDYFYPYYYNNNQNVYYIQSDGVTNVDFEQHQIMATFVFKF